MYFHAIESDGVVTFLIGQLCWRGRNLDGHLEPFDFFAPNIRLSSWYSSFGCFEPPFYMVFDSEGTVQIDALLIADSPILRYLAFLLLNALEIKNGVQIPNGRHTRSA